MVKNYVLPFFLVLTCLSFKSHAQELRIRKGVIEDSLMMADSINESFALYLPKNFELNGRWPLLTVFNMKGNGRNAVSRFMGAADSLGYVVASPNMVFDSISLSENMIRTKTMFDHLANLLPIDKGRTYTAGFDSGGRFASLVPIFLSEVRGTVAVNSSLANADLLNSRRPFYFIGIVATDSFNYTSLLQDEKVLNSLKFPNTILVYDSKETDVNVHLGRALEYLELYEMAKSYPKDTSQIQNRYERDIELISKYLKQNNLLLANRTMAETLNAFRLLKENDSLREAKRELKRSKEFRALSREQGTALFKERLLREDFIYYLEEDILTYNFNNLGWWNYQISQIKKFKTGDKAIERQMGERLYGFVNALVDDNIELVKIQKVVDEEALVLLYMLKTLTQSENYDNYLNVASIASKNEDYGTALFYLEEALKNGFKDKKALYSIPHTALLRITPEFNELVKKYFNDARYKIKDE